jgi:TPR repeat protein
VDSQDCESHSRLRTAVLLAGASLVLALAAAAHGAPGDDYKRGEQAYRGGDVVTAMAALRRAADQGHAPAQVLLAEILDRAEFDEEAIAWYRRAAEQGNAAGEYGLGSMTLAGEGAKKDAAQAWFWFARAAERKFEPAIIALANAHLRAAKGEEPVAPEPARAAEWLRKAAEIDYLPAVDALARAFREGGFGVAPDAAQAERYLAQAANLRRKPAADKGARKK